MKKSKYTFMPLHLTPAQDRATFHLPVEQEVYVPSTTNTSKQISNRAYKQRIAKVRQFLAKKFGGYTSARATGGYYSTKEHKLVKEPVTVVTSFAKAEHFPEKQKKLLSQIRRWRNAWKQDSMGYEFEGDLYYIGKNARKRRAR